ncbi:hypothetical protein DY000_02031267 [Brassica cretica]|uniref:Uncharacterized protein n=1 Tax=Brassica cretica TaxID=69181 RepID=A0ABQ7DVX2_BRACR|nr:hypothetical protein DY000_02031267 [Brassica cretica]
MRLMVWKAKKSCQEELCFINNNGTWYRKEPNFQYNNYQQRSYSNNQQGGYQPKQNTQQGSYQPRQNIAHGFNNHSNQSTQAQRSSSQAPTSDTSVDAMFKKLLDFQAKNEKTMGYEFKNIHSKIDGSYNELNNKFRNLENQFSSMNSQPTRQQGSLPGKLEQNPKETMKAITLRSGRELPPRVLTKDGEKQGREVAINIDDELVIVDEKVDEEILEKIVEAKGKGKCMITRSRGATNLVPRVEDIRALEREIARQRREVEQQAHLQRKEPNFQYNNYQQRSYSNNQHGGYQPSRTLSKGAISRGKTFLLVSTITAISLLKLKEVLHRLQLQIQVWMQCSRNSWIFWQRMRK